MLSLGDINALEKKNKRDNSVHLPIGRVEENVYDSRTAFIYLLSIQIRTL